MASPVRFVIKDDQGKPFEPAAMPHAFTYDVNGNKLTDTCIEHGTIARVKTFTYTEVGGVWLVETESAWINTTDSNVD